MNTGVPAGAPPMAKPPLTASPSDRCAASATYAGCCASAAPSVGQFVVHLWKAGLSLQG